jgi:phosphate transport system substrate-binding protein
MKIVKIAFSSLVALLFSTIVFADINVTGAGSSAVNPIVSKWAEAYASKGVRVNYASIGSGGGIKQINAKTVDFGASDGPVKGDDLDKHGQVQFPDVVFGISVVHNLKGFADAELKLDQKTLADIFLGKITVWNDSSIAKLNPGKKLPSSKITVVHRSDGSGTTGAFTEYLSMISSEWKDKVGKGKTVKWPSKGATGAKGNEGVSSIVKRIDGAIGYVEYNHAKKVKIAGFSLKNKAGKFVAPNLDSFAAAASNADWGSKPGMGISLNNQPGDASWPITSPSFIIMYKNPTDAKKSKAALAFFKYGFTTGKKDVAALDYVPLPDNVVAYIEKNIWSQIKN